MLLWPAWVRSVLPQEAAGLNLVFPSGTHWDFSPWMAFTSDTSCQDLEVCCCVFFYFMSFPVVTYWGAEAAPSTGVSSFSQPWEANPKTGWMLLVYPLSSLCWQLGMKDVLCLFAVLDLFSLHCCPLPLKYPFLAPSPKNRYKASNGMSYVTRF